MHRKNAVPTPPSILVIMPDDVGVTNVSAYSHGLMGETPNIDRIARDGMLFTDHYAHPSCTPGRAAFITGQLPIRTGLTTVGMAGSPIGLDARDPTLAELLKERDYRTGQFGEYPLGDRNSPAACSTASRDRDDPTDDGRFGPMGKQRCVDAGPMSPERMETVDDEFRDRAVEIMRRAAADDTPPAPPPETLVRSNALKNLYKSCLRKPSGINQVVLRTGRRADGLLPVP